MTPGHIANAQFFVIRWAPRPSTAPEPHSERAASRHRARDRRSTPAPRMRGRGSSRVPCPATASPSPRQTPALGGTSMPVPVRSLDSGAGCGGATDSVFTGMPLLVRRNRLARECPSPGAAHSRARFHSATTIRAGDSAGLSRAAAPFSQRYRHDGSRFHSDTSAFTGIPHFASVITLAKCGIALKTPLRLQNSPISPRRPRFQMPRSNDRAPACYHGRQAGVKGQKVCPESRIFTD